jgi:hypothetical protein
MHVITAFPHALNGFGVAAAAEKIAFADSFFVKVAARPRDNRRDDVKEVTVTGGQQPSLIAHNDLSFPLKS